jgi:hypothetical protein
MDKTAHAFFPLDASVYIISYQVSNNYGIQWEDVVHENIWTLYLVSSLAVDLDLYFWDIRFVGRALAQVVSRWLPTGSVQAEHEGGGVVVDKAALG